MAKIREVQPPNGLAGGPDTVVRILGDAFHGATGVSFGPGIEIIRFAIIDDGLIAVALRVLSNAAPGFRDVEVFGPHPDKFSGGFLIV